jgi:MoaA/NifB/PqqE/SkfB family radical SAM enzyme
MHCGSLFDDDYGPQRLAVELANICNLHCSYCLRSEEGLYSNRAEFFPLALLARIIKDAREVAAISRITFTGGEPTLHPQFSGAIETVAAAGLTSSFVTNGWHFERIWPAILANRESITHVAFSVDGITQETHDRWRGSGSFERLVRAFSRCYKAKVPFVMKIKTRRDIVDQLEQIAVFGARMGASGMSFGHIMPTSSASEDQSALSLQEQRMAEQEIALLARILKMNIGIDVGYYNIDERAPCSPLAGRSANVDYLGRLTLCCSLSGFRGAAEERDVVADLNVESFASAYSRLGEVAAAQLQKRKDALAALRSEGLTPDLYTGSPCLFCLQSYGKIPWHKTDAGPATPGARSLPILTAAV